MDCDLKVGTKRWRADDFEPYSEIPDHDLPITSGLATWLGILADRGLDWLPTYTVLTPSMGCHVYFSYDGEDIHPAVSWREALDVRAGGSYVVAAGSFIEDTRYELITNPFNEVMPIPSWLRDLLEQETIPASDGEIANPRPGSLKADLKDSRHLRNLE